MTKSRQSMPGEPPSTPGTPTGQPPTGGRPRGRRPHGGRTRAEILDAARHEFAALGYRGASLRTIAARADVDPHLIAHYFGSKMQLFLAIAELPFEPGIVLDQLYAAGQPGLGRRLAVLVASLSTAPASRETVTALVRAAASEEQAAALIREVVNERLLLPLIHRATDRATEQGVAVPNRDRTHPVAQTGDPIIDIGRTDVAQPPAAPMREHVQPGTTEVGIGTGTRHPAPSPPAIEVLLEACLPRLPRHVPIPAKVPFDIGVPVEGLLRCPSRRAARKSLATLFAGRLAVAQLPRTATKVKTRHVRPPVPADSGSVDLATILRTDRPS